jgi:hypothetical protein
VDPLTITIYSPQDFDGTTPLNGTRDDFEVSRQGRYYFRRIIEPAGVIRTDFWGLFSEGSPKIVGIAGSSDNPQNKVRLYVDTPMSFVRQVVDLTPRLQHVLVTPGDLLTVRTNDQGPVFLTLTVKDISEREHAELAAQERPARSVTRLRLGRTDGQGFSAAGATWAPALAWSGTSGLLGATENGAGPIVLSDLLQLERSEGYFVSVRYSNMQGAGTGKVLISEATTQSQREAQAGLTNVEWSKPQFLSHGDLLGLECAAPAVGKNVVADIEVTPVPPRGRLAGRYDRNL